MPSLPFGYGGWDHNLVHLRAEWYTALSNFNVEASVFPYLTSPYSRTCEMLIEQLFFYGE